MIPAPAVYVRIAAPAVDIWNPCVQAFKAFEEMGLTDSAVAPRSPYGLEHPDLEGSFESFEHPWGGGVQQKVWVEGRIRSSRPRRRARATRRAQYWRGAIARSTDKL